MPAYIDVSAAVHRRAGLGRYAENLARALLQAEPHRYALFYNRERGVEPLTGLCDVPRRSVSLGYKPWRMLVWMGQLAHLGFNRLVPGAELFHATEHLLMPLRGVPTVLTVHDLIFHHLPAYHKWLNRWYLNLTMPLFCRQATRVIAVSEHTRRDLIEVYGLSGDKITVVHEAADPRFCPQPQHMVEAVRSEYGLPERYLLFVGTVEPRKNLSRLVEVFCALSAEGLTDGLVIAGKLGWLYEGFLARLERSPARQQVTLTGYVPAADLPALYSGAQALVFPSLYEGFGLPVLEAMACGTPVACSDTSSLPEIAGDAALRFDPGDPESIAEIVRGLLQDADLRGALRKAGRQQAARFSWGRAAAETAAVYRCALGVGGAADAGQERGGDGNAG
jgi:glycosyltransferase involved in cell wall biosynthesis